MTKHIHDNSRIHRRILAVCEACGDFIEYWGFRSIHGRVWAFLALSQNPVSQKEIADALGVSRASISIAMTELSDYGLVRPITDHHHAPYEAVMDVWPVISGVLMKREWMLLETARIALETALEEFETAPPLQEEQGRDPMRDRINVDRLRSLLQMTEWAQAVLKMVINARLPKTTDRFNQWVGRALKWSQSLKSLLSGDDDDPPLRWPDQG